MRYEIHCDGACSPNPGRGGWAAIVDRIDGHTRDRDVRDGSADWTTNNRMELTAALEGLRATPEGSHVTVVLDSEYVHKGATRYLDTWRRHGWRTRAKADVKNRDLWEAIDTEQRNRRVEWKLVRGHTRGDGHHARLNALADELAVEARRS